MKCIFKMWILDLEILDVIFLILVLQGVTHIAHWCDEVSFLTVSLKGNPLCWNSNLSRFCESEIEDKNYSQNSTNTTSVCPAQACPPPYEYSPTSPVACFCALPLFIGYQLESPGFSDWGVPDNSSWVVSLSAVHWFIYMGRRTSTGNAFEVFFLYMMLKTTHVFKEWDSANLWYIHIMENS